MLTGIERDMAAEIKQHDWSDAPYRLDRAGHRREDDSNRGSDHLTETEADNVRINVMWVAAQVLKYQRPDLDVHEFAEACGTPDSFRLRRDGSPSGMIDAGIRFDHEVGNGQVQRPGTR